MNICMHACKLGSAQDGFTLLELLIAMTLLGFLTIVLFGGLKLGTQAWAHSETANARNNALEDARSVLASAIAHAYPLPKRDGVTTYALPFDGTKDRLSFLEIPADGSGAIQDMRIALVGDGGGRSLAIRARPELARDPAQHRIATLAEVSALEFSYFGMLKGDKRPAWHSTWQGQRHLPRLVRVRVRLAGKGHVAWPTLIVAPRIAAPAGCTIDLLTKSCQGM